VAIVSLPVGEFLMNPQLIIHTVLLQPIFELLKFLTIQTGNFGVAIILLTIVVRSALVPLTLPTLRSQQKMKLLKPQIDALKKKHKDDSKKLQQAQMELFKEHNVNPLAGCLPYIAQFAVLIALYNVLTNFVSTASQNGLAVNTSFLMFDLSKPDHSLVIPILAALSQLILSLMILPGAEKHDLIPNNSKKKDVQKANEKETNAQEMAESMQKQMVFMMPIMTGIFAYQFPAGLGIYWVATTVFSIVQQWFVSGPGGLVDIVTKVKSFKK
jgi:YidC/Oxa1 family membrane protein insertase